MGDAAAIAAALERVFDAVWRERMRGLPIVNPALSVEVVGPRFWEGRWLGALVTPWSINLALAPVGDDGAPALRVGEKRVHAFPAGRFAFIGAFEPGFGRFETCSLFSPVTAFADQETARAAAQAALDALFLPEETGPGEAGPGKAGPPGRLSRRDLFRGALGRDREEGP